MRLKRVEVENFRSIREATLELEPRCRILVGKNEVGKTNLLAACSLLDESVDVVPADLREPSDDEEPVKSGHVRFVFGLTREQVLAFQDRVSKKVFGGAQILCAGSREALTTDGLCSNFYEVLYDVGIPSGKREYQFYSLDDDVQLADGWLIPRRDVERSSAITLKSGATIALGKISLVHESQLLTGIAGLFLPATLSNVFSLYADLALESTGRKLPACLLWRYADGSLLPASINIDAFRSNPASCEPLRAMFLLAGEKEPANAITDALQKPQGMRNLLTRVAKKTTTHIKQRWPEFGTAEISLYPNGAQIDASVRDAFNEYSFDRRSDGFKRFISFLILISARSSVRDLNEVLFSPVWRKKPSSRADRTVQD